MPSATECCRPRRSPSAEQAANLVRTAITKRQGRQAAACGGTAAAAAPSTSTSASAEVVDVPQQEDQQQPRRRQTSRNATCGKCVEARAKCSGSLPCERCFRMCLVCRPSRYQEDETEDQLPLLHIIFKRHDARPSAEKCLEAFAEAVAAGAVDRSRVLPIVWMWRALSTLSGTDASWGIMAGVTRLLVISDEELEGPSPVAAHVPPEETAQRRLWAEEMVQQLRVQSLELQRSELFRALDDGFSAQFMFILADGARGLHASNEPFDRLFLPAMELVEVSLRNKTLQLLLFAALFEEEDRGSWFRGLIQALFGRDGRDTTFTRFVKMVDREGGVGLYTLKTVQLHARHWPPGPTTTTAATAASGAIHGGASSPSRPPRSYGILVRLEPVPPTLHLTARPDLVGAAADAPLRPSSPPAAAAAAGSSRAPTGEASRSRRSRPARLYAYAYANQFAAAPVSAARRGMGRASAGATTSEAATDGARGSHSSDQLQQQQRSAVFPSLATIPALPRQNPEARPAPPLSEDMFRAARSEVQEEVMQSALGSSPQLVHGPLRRSARGQLQQRQRQRAESGDAGGEPGGAVAAPASSAEAGVEPPLQALVGTGSPLQLSPALLEQQAPNSLLPPLSQEDWPLPVPVLAADIEELEGLFQD